MLYYYTTKNHILKEQISIKLPGKAVPALIEYFTHRERKSITSPGTAVPAGGYSGTLMCCRKVFLERQFSFPALGHASRRKPFWNKRLRHAVSKRKGACAPAVIDVSFAHVMLPRTNAPAATSTIGAPPRSLRAAAPHALDAANDIAAAARTPTTQCRGAQRSWRPVGPGRREHVGEDANPGPHATDSREAPSALGSPAPMRCRRAC